MAQALLPLLRVLCGIAVAIATVAAAGTPKVGQSGKDVIWVPTPEKAVERMLTIARVGPADLVVDLGSGDGRIVIAAAKQFGARALGLELNPELVRLSEQRAAREGVSDRAKFLMRDIFEADLRQASVITLYLLPELNLKLRPRLLALAPGTRVVAHAFDMGDWLADEFDASTGASVRLWIVPAQVAGLWTWNLPGRGGERLFELELGQQFQRIQGLVTTGDRRLRLRAATLQGNAIGFTLLDEQNARTSVKYDFSGTVNGNRMEGAVRVSNQPRPLKWVATRAAEKPS